jgi:hypothetical protein
MKNVITKSKSLIEIVHPRDGRNPEKIININQRFPLCCQFRIQFRNPFKNRGKKSTAQAVHVQLASNVIIGTNLRQQ